MLKYIHLDEKEDTLIQPLQIKYVCLFEPAKQDSLVKLDTLRLDVLFEKTCTSTLSPQQHLDIANYQNYLQNQHKEYADKSWIYKLRKDLKPQPGLQTLRSKLKDNLKISKN